MRRLLEDPRNPVRVLVAATVAAAGLILVLGRGTSFSADEVVFLATAPDLNLRTVLEPHGGHLLAITRLVYKAIAEANGLDYLPFRVLALATVIAMVWLLFAWARRRVDPWVAALLCMVLLFLGSDFLHTFHGNGFTVLSSICFGLAALLAFDRGDRRGDAWACAFLVLGVLSYSVILAFIAGIGFLTIYDRASWRRIWVALVPLGLYILWRLWLVVDDVGSAGTGIELSNLLLVPAWAFQSLAGVIAALSGLGYAFGGSELPAGADGLSAVTEVAVSPVGPPLALAALAGLCWSIGRRGLGPILAATILMALVLWTMQALVGEGSFASRVPGGDSRYLYPGAVLVLLVAFAAAGPGRPSDRGLALLAVWSLSAIAVNVMVLRDGAERAEKYGHQIEGMAGVFKITGTADRDADTSSTTGLLSAVANSPYGDFGSGLDELRARPADERGTFDMVIGSVAVSGAVEEGEPCPPGRTIRPEEIASADGPVEVISPTGGTIMARFFADRPTVELASLRPGVAATIDLPEVKPLEWRLSAPGVELRTCRADGTER